VSSELPYILQIKSRKSELAKVQAFLNKVFNFYKIPQKHFNNTFLCISEAILNSIAHGNKYDNSRSVNIHIDYCLQEIWVKIQDEGEGFDPDKLENPTLSKNIKRESGRGIHIIKSLAETVIFNSRGNCIQFKISCR